MKKILALIILPLICFSQNSESQASYFLEKEPISQNTLGCQDLDEILIDIVSIFGDTSLLEELLGCEELIPTLESGILSAFLPFEIPLDCSTDLTPFGYLDLNLDDVCQCSCEPFLDISTINTYQPKLIKTIDILGRKNNNTYLYLELYDDGTIIKKHQISNN